MYRHRLVIASHTPRLRALGPASLFLVSAWVSPPAQVKRRCMTSGPEPRRRLKRRKVLLLSSVSWRASIARRRRRSCCALPTRADGAHPSADLSCVAVFTTRLGACQIFRLTLSYAFGSSVVFSSARFRPTLPKSTRPDRMAANFDLRGFTLNDQEMKELEALEAGSVFAFGKPGKPMDPLEIA